MLALALLLVTVGSLTLLIPLFTLNLLCGVAGACQVSVFAEAVNQAFFKHALHSPHPELSLVAPLLIGVAVALRNPFGFKAEQSGGQHAD